MKGLDIVNATLLEAAQTNKEKLIIECTDEKVLTAASGVVSEGREVVNWMAVRRRGLNEASGERKE